MPPTLPRRAAPPAALLAALVACLTLASLNRAYAISITPNALQYRYTFAANGELLIGVPVQNQAVHVMATCETVGHRGIAYADVLRAAGTEPFVMWTGQHSFGAGTPGGNTSGFSSLDERLIATVSSDGDVELEVQDPATMAISNESGAARTGYVTLFW